MIVHCMHFSFSHFATVRGGGGGYGTIVPGPRSLSQKWGIFKYRPLVFVFFGSGRFLCINSSVRVTASFILAGDRSKFHANLVLVATFIFRACFELSVPPLDEVRWGSGGVRGVSRRGLLFDSFGSSR